MEKPATFPSDSAGNGNKQFLRRDRRPTPHQHPELAPKSRRPLFHRPLLFPPLAFSHNTKHRICICFCICFFSAMARSCWGRRKKVGLKRSVLQTKGGRPIWDEKLFAQKGFSYGEREWAPLGRIKNGRWKTQGSSIVNGTASCCCF